MKQEFISYAVLSKQGSPLSVVFIYKPPDISLMDPKLANAFYARAPNEVNKFKKDLDANLLSAASDTRNVRNLYIQRIISQDCQLWHFAFFFRWSSFSLRGSRF